MPTSQKTLTNSKSCIILTNHSIENRVASAIAYNMLKNYYDIIVLYHNTSFVLTPPNLWQHDFIAIIGSEVDDITLRTIRACIHDRNIVWLDNDANRIPLWNDYGMLPGDRVVGCSIVELAWRYWHDMNEPNEKVELFFGIRSITNLAEFIK